MTKPINQPEFNGWK